MHTIFENPTQHTLLPCSPLNTYNKTSKPIRQTFIFNCFRNVQEKHRRNIWTFYISTYTNVKFDRVYFKQGMSQALYNGRIAPFVTNAKSNRMFFCAQLMQLCNIQFRRINIASQHCKPIN
jgi:hypothetical protein